MKLTQLIIRLGLLASLAAGIWDPGVPILVKNHIRPNTEYQTPDAAYRAWDMFNLAPPDPSGYVIPPVPPRMNPALARAPYRGYQTGGIGGIPFGVPQLLWYDPRSGPPPGAMPLIPPTTDAPNYAGYAGVHPPFDALPMPSSFQYAHAGSYGNHWVNPHLPGYPQIGGF